MKSLCSLSVAIILLLSAIAVEAEEKQSDFPQKPINFIMGFPAGGKIDIQVRGIAPFLQKYLGVPINVQNFPGAAGRIAFTKLFKAVPDGYNIGSLSIPAVIIGEYLAAVEYKTLGFTPIFACFVTPQVLVVAADTYKSVNELIAAGKLKTLSNASAGFGTSSYLAGLAVANSLGLKGVRQVHFTGGAPSLASLAGKHVDFSITNTTAALPLVRAGKLKALLTISDKRDSSYPEVPTPKELGYTMTTIPAIDGIAGPPHLPPERAKILEDAFTRAASDPEFLNWAKNAKLDIDSMSHEKFHQAVSQMVKEVEKYKEYLVQK